MSEDGCNVDDIICQVRILNHLQGLQDLMSTESFQATYADFIPLGDKVKEQMAHHRENLAELMQGCAVERQPEQTEQEIPEPEEYDG